MLLSSNIGLYDLEEMNEKDISAQQKAKSKDAWLHEKNEHCKWQKNNKQKKEKGQETSISISISFTKEQHLRKAEDYKSVFKYGKKFVEREFVIYIKDSDVLVSRFGIVASKKVGNSVKRNRAKRVMREIFRIRIAKYQHIDIVMISRRRILHSQFNRLGDIFENVVTTFLRNGTHKDRYVHNIQNITYNNS